MTWRCYIVVMFLCIRQNKSCIISVYITHKSYRYGFDLCVYFIITSKYVESGDSNGKWKWTAVYWNRNAPSYQIGVGWHKEAINEIALIINLNCWRMYMSGQSVPKMINKGLIDENMNNMYKARFLVCSINQFI